jgi:protein gp37
MAENTLIAWATHTFNPWFGCQKVSPACDWCYAESLMDHRYHKVQWGPHGERKRTSPENWKKPRAWNKKARAAGERHRVFCASLADWLDNKAPQQWRDDLAELIEATPDLDWLLLTKRPENYSRLAPWHRAPENVWLGVSAENQEYFDHRWGILRQIPATIRFISYEPALGPLSILNFNGFPDWIICGGESKQGKDHTPRLMEPAWARNLRAECEEADVAFFLKQMTNLAPIPPDLMVRQFPMTPAPATGR